ALATPLNASNRAELESNRANERITNSSRHRRCLNAPALCWLRVRRIKDRRERLVNFPSGAHRHGGNDYNCLRQREIVGDGEIDLRCMAFGRDLVKSF